MGQHYMKVYALINVINSQTLKNCWAEKDRDKNVHNIFLNFVRLFKSEIVIYLILSLVELV